MLIGEPPRTPYDLNLVLFGIPVRVHPFFWVLPILIGARRPNLQELLALVVAWFLSILIHELGHAAVMRSYGLYPWIVLYGLGGLTSYSPSQAWQARRPGPLREILISAAGPAAGFLFAALILLALSLAGHEAGVVLGGHLGVMPYFLGQVGSPVLTSFLWYLLSMAFYWGILNLMPVYPLDGGQIAREILMQVYPRQGIRWSLLLSAATATVLAVLGLVVWQQIFLAFLFGYLAYTSYAILQASSGRGPG